MKLRHILGRILQLGLYPIKTNAVFFATMYVLGVVVEWLTLVKAPGIHLYENLYLELFLETALWAALWCRCGGCLLLLEIWFYVYAHDAATHWRDRQP